MTCPKCQGTLEGPQFENTTQGRVLTIHCLNCGWRENDSVLAIPMDRLYQVFPRCQPDVRKHPKPRKLWDLSKYEFEPLPKKETS